MSGKAPVDPMKEDLFEKFMKSILDVSAGSETTMQQAAGWYKQNHGEHRDKGVEHLVGLFMSHQDQLEEDKKAHQLMQKIMQERPADERGLRSRVAGMVAVPMVPSFGCGEQTGGRHRPIRILR